MCDGQIFLLLLSVAEYWTCVPADKSSETGLWLLHTFNICQSVANRDWLCTI